MSGPQPSVLNHGNTGSRSAGTNSSHTYAKLVASNLAISDPTLQVTVSGTRITVSNVSEESLINLSLLSPTSVYNFGLQIVHARVSIPSYVNHFSVIGLSELMEQSNGYTITTNQTAPNPPLVYKPFGTSILGGNDINKVADTLSGLSPYTPHTLSSPKTYDLTLNVIPLHH